MNNLIIKYKNLPIQVKASVWFLFCSVLQKGISVITIPIFTRIMSASEYGSFNVFLSWQGVLTAIVVFTLPHGVFMQGIIKFPEKRDKLTSELLGLVTFLVLIWFVIYFIFQNRINSFLSINTIQVVAMLVLIWTTSVFDFWAIGQRVDYKYKRLVVLTLVVSVIKPILCIYLVTHSDDKVSARILGMVAVDLCFYVWIFFDLLNKGRSIFSAESWKYALIFNLPLVPHYLSQRVLDSSDRIMIEHFVGSDKAGIYSLACSISLFLIIVNNAIQNAINPWIFQKIKDHAINDIKKLVYPSIIVVVVINLILIMLAPELVKLFAPAEYYEAVWVIPPITMSVFFMFLYNFFANFEFYYEKTKYTAIATVIGALLNVVLNIVLIPRIGYMAAGYTTLFCYIIYALAHYYIMSMICKKNNYEEAAFSSKLLFLISIIFMTIGFAILTTYNYFIIRYCIIFIVLVAILIMHKRIISFARSLFHEE